MDSIRRLRRGVAGAITMILVASGLAASGALPPGSPSALAGPTDYISLLPARLADTRPDGETTDGQFRRIGMLAAGSTTAVRVAGRGGVAVDAETAVLNVTVTQAQAPGFITAYPCGSPLPLASNLNFVAGSEIPNAVVVKLGDDGDVCFYAFQATHLVVDVNGYHPPGSAYRSLVPARLMDTRADGETIDNEFEKIGLRAQGSVTELTVAGRGGVAANAATAVLNVTVTETLAPGFVTAYPCGGPLPLASNLNFVTGTTIPNAVIVKIGADGKVCLFASNPLHLVVDVGGYYTPGPAYTSLVPARLMDTRPDGATADDQFARIGMRAQGSTTELVVAGRGGVIANPGAVVLNITVTQPQAPGFITAYPCGGPLPLASNLNFIAGSEIPNAVIVKVGTGGAVCLFASNPTHLVVDVGGYSPANVLPGDDVIEVLQFSNLLQTHLAVATPIAYPQSPPVGGPHWPIPQQCGYYDEAIDNEYGVHSLEHGAVWITYRPDLPSDQITKLRALLAGQTHVMISPYPGLSDPVVASSWGWQMRVHNDTDIWPTTRSSVLAAFIAEHDQEGPEQLPCTLGVGDPIENVAGARPVLETPLAANVAESLFCTIPPARSATR